MICGILRPDEGEITVDGEQIYENPKMKEQVFYISDDSYFPANATPSAMEEFYRRYYPAFDSTRFIRCSRSLI